jgi:hypothetical protein
MATQEYYKQQLAAANASLATYKNNLQQYKRVYANLSQAQFNNLPDVKQLNANIARTNATISELTSKVAGAVSSVTDTASKQLSELAGGNSDLMSTISAKVSEVASAATDIGAKSISSIASGAKNLASSVFGSSGSSVSGNAALASAKADVGKSETDTKIQSISASDTSAIKNPVAFVTKTVTETVAATSSAIDNSIKQLIPSTGQLAAEAKKLQQQLGTDGGMMSTITGITNDLSSQLKNNIPAMASSMQAITGSAAATVRSVASSVGTVVQTGIASADILKNTISSTISFASPIVATTSSVIRAGAELTSSVANLIPNAIGGALGVNDPRITNALTSMLADTKIGSLANLSRKLDGIADTTDLWSSLLGLNGSYPTAVNAGGVSLANKVGNNDASFVNKLYALAGTLCDNIVQDEAYNKSQDKDLYDILLGLTGSKGMSDLLSQLSKCSGTSGSLFDSRSLNLLRNMTPSIAKKGDIRTYAAIVGAISAANVISAKTELGVLAANVTTSVAKATGSMFSDLVSGMGFGTTKDIVTDSTPAGDAYNGKSVALMSSSNTVFIDSAIGTADRSLVQASMSVYY